MDDDILKKFCIYLDEANETVKKKALLKVFKRFDVNDANIDICRECCDIGTCDYRMKGSGCCMRYTLFRCSECRGYVCRECTTYKTEFDDCYGVPEIKRGTPCSKSCALYSK